MSATDPRPQRTGPRCANPLCGEPVDRDSTFAMQLAQAHPTERTPRGYPRFRTWWCCGTACVVEYLRLCRFQSIATTLVDEEMEEAAP